MKAEETFIRKLECYFDDTFNDFTKNRIRVYLREFRDELPLTIIKREKEEPIVNHDVTEKRISSRANSKNFVTKEELKIHAFDICELYNIQYDDFVQSRTGTGTQKIIEARKIFCNMIYEKFLCYNYVLARFFNVHHSTISFYLYGKKYLYKRRKKQADC
jgi:hypothetical protein